MRFTIRLTLVVGAVVLAVGASRWAPVSGVESSATELLAAQPTPTVAKHAPQQLQGRVVGANGGAVSGATVALTAYDDRPGASGWCLETEDEDDEPRCDSLAEVRRRLDQVARHEGLAVPVANAITGDDGAFRFDAPLGQVFAVWASEPKLGVAVVSGVHPEDTPRLVLAPPGTLHGLVARGLEPVPGARVVAMLDSARCVLETTADARGAYRFDSLPVGPWRLIADVPGALPEVRLYPWEFQRLDFEEALFVTVPFAAVARVTRDDQPAAGVQVTLTGDHLRLQARTRSDGEARFEGLRRGEYQLEASAPPLGARASVERSVEFMPSADHPLDLEVPLRLEAGRELDVSVRGQDDTPVPGASVTVHSLGFQLELSALTDAHGIAHLGWAPHWPLAVSVLAEGFVTVSDDALLEPEVILAPAALVTGWVVDASGRPVAGAGVSPIVDPELLPEGVVTDADGSFRLTHLEPGPVRLEASEDHGPTTVADVVAPAAGVVLVLGAGPDVSPSTVADGDSP